MHLIEHALASKVIHKMVHVQGYGRQAAVLAAQRLLMSQGFGERYSREIAIKMARLVG